MKFIIFVVLCYITFAVATNESESSFFKGLESFSGYFISELSKERPEESIISSPLGVAIPLAQLVLGASGPSQEELLKTLNFPNVNTIRENTPRHVQQLTSLKGVTFEVADRIYFQNGYELSQKFQKDVKDIFQTELQNVDFSKAATVAEEINHWVENATHGKITDLLKRDSLDASTVSVIVNAVYFKGAWKYPFKKEKSEQKEFNVNDARKVTIPFMHQENNFYFADDKGLNAKVIRLPYSEEEADMWIYLPNEINDLQGVLKRLHELEKSGQSVELRKSRVEIFLPSFKTQTTIDLKQLLPKVGVSKIFDAKNAGLTGVLESGENIFISNAAQKAFIEVNEIGSEAAAATSFQTNRRGMVVNGEVFKFIADRPFFYRIQSGPLTLFSGLFYGA